METVAAAEFKKGSIFPIRWKLILYFIVFMSLIIFIGLYINLGLKLSAQFFKGILDEYKFLEVVGEKVYAVKFYTENYLADNSYASLEKCLAANAALRDETDHITEYLYLVDNEEKYYRYLDLASIVANFLDLSEKTVSAKRDGLLEMAYENNYKMTLSSDLIAKFVANLINLNATWGNERFLRLTKQAKKIEYWAYLIACLIGLLSITFCINFSLGITQPLEQMVRNAQKIAAGEFEVGEVSAQSGDELQIITRVFNRMSRNIHDLFREIQEKAALERELKEEKMRNLEIENLLRESEIQVLQSQINPHFLYNTLNAISQVAILEDASETGDLIKAVARLLRYNLRSLDQPVTLEDEINHVKEYLYIMGVRYGDRIDCQIDCGGDLCSAGALRKYLIPCMTLQPIIENAYIHGLANIAGRRGKIAITATDEGDHLQIVIADDGAGIKPQKLARILASENNRESGGRAKKNNTTGLGLANIRKRLELFYKRDDLFTMSSAPGEGTRVMLRLPMIEEDRADAQFNDCG